MNYLTKSKIILYLALIFTAGGITGAVIGWGEAKQKPPVVWDSKKMCSHFKSRLESELGLTPTQVQKLEPLLEKQVKAMEEIHARTVKEVEEVFRKSNQEIAAALQLTQQQQQKFAEMEKSRRDLKNRRSKPRDGLQ
jgi:Spy/CpxP family protein refolding chaperone